MHRIRASAILFICLLPNMAGRRSRSGFHCSRLPARAPHLLGQSSRKGGAFSIVTAHYITDLLQEANVKVTRLAHGVPVGGELDYLDEGTLSAAMRQRTLF